MFVVFRKEEDHKVSFVLRITECTCGHVAIRESFLVATSYDVPPIVNDDKCCVDMMVGKVSPKYRSELDMMLDIGAIRDPNDFGSKKASFRKGIFETQVERKCRINALRKKTCVRNTRCETLCEVLLGRQILDELLEEV